MRWVVWGLMIVLLNVSVTWLARARSSASLAYHGYAALAANTLWILNQLFLIGTVLHGSSFWGTVWVVLFYVGIATASGVLTHRYLLSLEKGDMRVGANHRVRRDRFQETDGDRAGQDYARRPTARV